MAAPKEIRGLVRQGDVLLIPIDRSPTESEVIRTGTRLVIAEGEATGHAHAVLADEAELIESADGVLYLRVVSDDGAVLVHDEHDALALAPGHYEVRRQREYAPEPGSGERFRRVAD